MRQLEPYLLVLALHKFGRFVVEALVQSSVDTVRETVTRMLEGRVADWSQNPTAHIVVEAAVRHGQVQQQKQWIEEVCRVGASQVEKPVVGMCKNKFGHKVVQAMLEVSIKRQVMMLLTTLDFNA